MHYIVLLLTLLSFPAMAQLKIDDGIRSPQNMVVSGSSVIDDDDATEDTIEIPDSLSEEEQKMLEGGTDDFVVGSDMVVEPNFPTKPTVKRPNVKQVVRPHQPVKIRRAIADDRIDDSYVQGLIKDNSLFTPHYKDKK